ncbi:hypothetical protein FOZ63_026354 [Perkinsus olseni]|uniref:Uncharacterized protein n=1 Tax=Perkinsus olseni TaxID=32597 RepID=A0A7J6UM58_PEROL|nr:hypothetical protein FOZ63_026354 [Perkinsus olseni]
MFDTPPTVIAKLSRTRGLGRNATDLPSLSLFSVARAQVPALAVELNNGVKMRMLGLGTTDSSDTLAAGAVYEAIRAGYRLLT